jgi:hypothetical protein
MTLNPATRQQVEWSQLVNVLVEIRQNGQTIRKGIIGNAMPNSSALWIAADSTSPRRIFEVSQGHQVWVTPQELSGDLHYWMTTKQISDPPVESHFATCAPVRSGKNAGLPRAGRRPQVLRVWLMQA